MLPTDLAIFSLAELQHPVVHPDPRELGSPRAARVCAASFSWWGKTRSMPPPWISKPTPSSSSAIAEHSMCQPGRPAAPRRVPGRVLALLLRLPQREVERVLLAARRPRRPRPGPSRRRRGARARRSRRTSARGSRRRRRPRRRGRGRSAPAIRSTIGPIVSRGQRLVVGPAEAEARRCRRRRRRSSRAPAPRSGRPRSRGGVVDLVVDVGDVGDERRRRSPRARGSA